MQGTYKLLHPSKLAAAPRHPSIQAVRPVGRAEGAEDPEGAETDACALTAMSAVITTKSLENISWVI